MWPLDKFTHEEYVKKTESTVVTHVFEKMLKLKDLMLTDTGKKEALERHKFMLLFLKEYFNEQNLPIWNEYLDNYVKRLIF